MEVDRIRKVADMIEAHPEHFDMSTFISGPGGMVRQSCWDVFACDTTACIGGWAVYLYAAEVDDNDLPSVAAARILGLTVEQKEALFSDAIDVLVTADLAAAHLRGMADDYEAASA